jgi:hypothetical protein
MLVKIGGINARLHGNPTKKNFINMNFGGFQRKVNHKPSTFACRG